MSVKDGLNEYRRSRQEASKEITGGGRLKLLYSMLVHNLLQVEGFMKREEYPEKRGVLVGSSLDIFGQLLGALDRKKGGEIAENLEMIYHYCMQKLLEGQRHSDPVTVSEVCKLVKILKTAWDEVA